MIKRLITSSVVFLGMTAGSLLAGQSGLLAPHAFPEIGKSSPYRSSTFYIHEQEVAGGQAEVELVLDTPKGALAVVLGENTINAEAQEQKLNGLSYNEPELNSMDLPSMGTRFELGKLQKGNHSMKISNSGRRSVRMVVNQPESPLSLKTRVTPLAARSGEWVSIEAKLDDMEFHKKTQLHGVLSNGKKFSLKDNGKNGDLKAGDGVYTAKFRAPKVEGMQSMDFRIEARGKRGKNSGDFRRTGISSMMIISPASGFRGNIQADSEHIKVPLHAANGKFRVAVIYGVEGKTLAWKQEDVVLSGGNDEIWIAQPKEAAGADRALIRLLNFQTMGLEAEKVIELHPTVSAPLRSTAMFKAKALPKSKQDAAAKFGN